MTDTTQAHTEHLRRALETLHAARVAYAEVSDHIDELRQQWEEEHAALLFDQQHRRQVAADAEQMVRKLTLAHYVATGEKKPTPGAEVAVSTVAEYEDDDALAWARSSGMCLIPESLDRKALIKVAKATSLPFVTFREEPAVRIATDLGKALATEAPAPAGDVA